MNFAGVGGSYFFILITITIMMIKANMKSYNPMASVLLNAPLCKSQRAKVKRRSQEQLPEALLVGFGSPTHCGFGFPTRIYSIIM
jgi:hypothetical protein